MNVEFKSTIADSWLKIKPIQIGSIPIAIGTPDVYVVVQDGKNEFMRIEIFAEREESFCFSDVAIWDNWIVIGYGHRLYLVGLNDKKVLSFNLDDYYGHLYIKENFLLVASASRLFAFTSGGIIKWKSEILGIDGVIVHEVKEEIIKGDGEWDPPDGWESFEVSTTDGKKIGSK